MAPLLNVLGAVVAHLLATSPTILDPTAEIVAGAKDLYKSLSNPGHLSLQQSPTVSFSFVPPPSSVNTPTGFAPIRDWKSRPSETTDNIAPYRLSDNSAKELLEKIASEYGQSKPIAIFLPGADGVGISATSQFDSLSSTFELWRMIVSTSDRSSFAALVDGVYKLIDQFEPNRKIYLIGESFGGLLAPGVALRMANSKPEKNRLPDGLIMVNPATSFDDSSWDVVGPLLTSIGALDNPLPTENRPSLYSVVGGLTLSALIPDRTQFNWIYKQISKTQVQSVSDVTNLVGSMSDGFRILSNSLPPETMLHRLTRWLPSGTAAINPRLKDLNVPTVVIAGNEDNLLPTKSEAERLVRVMPNATWISVPGSGHFVLDGRVNLTKVIVESNLWDNVKEKKDAVVDWVKPTEDVTRQVIENSVKPLRNLVSPVFFSTSTNGTRRLGLSALPSPENSGPLLFVANHQFGGLDLGLIISELIEQRNIYARGLAHPIIFNSTNGGGGGRNNQFGNGFGQNPFQETDPLRSQSLFETFGAVMVTPRNYYRLLETGQNALLFPGGVREVFHGKNEAYRLFWPEDKSDFVRVAAKFNATVIPISAVGAADSVNILIDAPDLVNLPFGLGERALNGSRNVMAARFDRDNEDELFSPPFFLPKPLPARHYFVFGKPLSTKDLNHRDRDACWRFYEEVKMEMERGFDDVLRAREDDPWGDTAQRLLFERVTGKPAPTFGLHRFKQ